MKTLKKNDKIDAIAFTPCEWPDDVQDTEFDTLDDLVPEGGFFHPEDGLLSMASVLMSRVPLKNIGGLLYAQLDGVVYHPIDEEGLMSVVRKQFGREFVDQLSCGYYGALHRYLRSFDEIKLPDIPVYEHQILFKDGLYDVRKNKFVDVKPGMVLVHRVRAKLKKKPTPHFDAFVADISGGDPEIRRLILAMIGYILLPEPYAKVFFVLGPAPNAGKSVLGNFLRRLIGEENTSGVPLNELGGQFSKSSMLGRRLNVSMDLDEQTLDAKAVRDLKMLTGDDTVVIDVKHKTPVTLKPMIKFLFGTNAPLKLKNDDEAFWNRLVVIPFLYSISPERQNKNLGDHLWKERHGIVYQAVKEARTLINENYRFPKCQAAEDMKQQWKERSGDMIEIFLRKRCILGEGIGPTPTAKLFKAYESLCAEKGISAGKMTGFSRKLNKLDDLEDWSDGKKRGYYGVVLRDDPA